MHLQNMFRMIKTCESMYPSDILVVYSYDWNSSIALIIPKQISSGESVNVKTNHQIKYTDRCRNEFPFYFKNLVPRTRNLLDML